MSGAATPPPAPSGVAGGSVASGRAKVLGILLLCAAVMLLWFLLGGADGPPRRQEDTGASPGPAGAARAVKLPPPPERTEPAPSAAQQAAVLAPPAAVQRTVVRPRTQPRKPAPIMGWEAPEDRQEAQARSGAGRDEDGENPDDQLTARLQATRTPAARARRMRNPDFVIAQGTMIPIVRETPINTQLPGFVRAKVPVDVLGGTGRLALLPAGTVLTGQIQQNVAHGTNRGFVLWTRARTPDGVTVELGGPGTDARGMNGVELDVRTNFWARFGGAVMLSFIDAGLQAAAILASNAAQVGDGQRVNFFQLQSGGRSAAATALNATVNIPPWGTAPEGEVEAVFTARDLDFSGVYRLEVAR